MPSINPPVDFGQEPVGMQDSDIESHERDAQPRDAAEMYSAAQFNSLSHGAQIDSIPTVNKISMLTTEPL